MKGTGLQLPRATIGVSRWRRFRAAVDWPLILTVIALCSIGLLNLYSATVGTRHAAKFDTQVKWMLVGAAGFIVATAIDYRTLVRLAWLGLGVAVVLLIVVRLIGEGAHGKGSYRWLNLFGMGIQPSELAKLMVILVLAQMFQEDSSRQSPMELALKGLGLAIPIDLIAMQPDLSSAVLLALIALAVDFLVMQSV
jgi:rod shape determining protein RodA